MDRDSCTGTPQTHGRSFSDLGRQSSALVLAAGPTVGGGMGWFLVAATASTIAATPHSCPKTGGSTPN